MPGAGQVTLQAVSANVVNGAFNLQIADTTQTLPANMCYAVYATNAQKEVVLGSSPVGLDIGYSCVQIKSSWCSGAACNFDSYSPTPRGGALPTGTDPSGLATAAQRQPAKPIRKRWSHCSRNQLAARARAMVPPERKARLAHKVQQDQPARPGRKVLPV